MPEPHPPILPLALLAAVATLLAAGCHSPFYTDRGAVTGGALGTGLGAIIGNQSGNAAEGALAGAAIGGLSGALIGNSLDEINARNQALIAGQLGRAPAPGAVTNGEVIAMSQAGVSDDLIITHIRAGGAVASPTSQQLVELSSAGVSDSVIAALQTPVQPVAIVPVEPLPPPPVFLSSRFHPLPPYRCAPRRRFYGPPFPPAPGLSFGVSYSN